VAHQTCTKTQLKKQQKRKEQSGSVEIPTAPFASMRPCVTIKEVNNNEADTGQALHAASAPPAIASTSQIPKVCLYIQTFPSTHTDITFRQAEGQIPFTFFMNQSL
jgi:hypothetical protein